MDKQVGSAVNEAEPVADVQDKKRNKLTMFGITLLALIVIAASWYFMYFTKTPEYSINKIRKAVIQHDVATFKKHVDLDSLLANAYDDMIAAMLASDPKLSNDNFSRGLVESLAKLFKGMVVAEGKYSVLRYVETGQWDRQDDSKQPQAKSPTPSVKEMTKNTGLNNATFKGVAYIKQEANIANIGAKILLPESNKEVVLDVKMRKLPDSSWQIVEISNLKEFILETEQAKKMSSAS